METVTVNITRASVLADMKVKSHAEVAHIQDDKQRYLAELGTEKEQEAHQCITDAASDVAAFIRPLLVFTSGTETATDAYDTTAAITYTLSVTARKAPGMADALAKTIHAYIVDAALSKFYGSVAQGDLAEIHRVRLASELADINNIIYRRSKPTYTA